MTAFARLWSAMTICLLLLPSSAALADEGHKRESCRVCGMYIDQYEKTSAELVFKEDKHGGRKEYTCGVACMLREVEEAGGVSSFSSVKVHDWISGELVDAQSATYVVGSKVIPDMIPNYIAFSSREEAKAFAARQGGELMTFDAAMADISPVGTTAPFRIRTAVTPGSGNFSAGAVYGYVFKNELRVGPDHMDPGQFINSNPAQPKAPNEARTQQAALFFNYSPTDRISLFLNAPWLWRMSDIFVRDPATGQVNGKSESSNGVGDIAIEGRYNFWHSTRFDKFATILIGTSIPSGDFDGARTLDPISGRQLVVKSPALQIGKGVPAFRGGLLYSQRWKKFWLHGSVTYDVNPENFDDFAFGNIGTLGMALHYTPTYDLMLGVEMDGSYTWENTDSGFDIRNSGGVTSNAALVFDYRFLNALGGNFKLRGAIGLPVYEDLNYGNVTNPKSGMPFQQVQLGGGFFANLGLQWTIRFAPKY